MQPALVVRSLAVAMLLALVVGCSASTGDPATQPPGATQAPGATRAPEPTPAGGDDPTADPTDAAGGAVDYCALFTTDQLASIVGQPVHVGDTSLLFGLGCRWDAEDGRGGVVIQHSPVQAGFGDIAQGPDMRALPGVGDQATIGRAAFHGVSPDGPFDATIAAAIVGEGFDSVVVAPPPADDDVIGLLNDLIGTDR